LGRQVRRISGTELGTRLDTKLEMILEIEPVSVLEASLEMALTTAPETK
jgi:hypothetical protein